MPGYADTLSVLLYIMSSSKSIQSVGKGQARQIQHIIIPNFGNPFVQSKIDMASYLPSTRFYTNFASLLLPFSFRCYSRLAAAIVSGLAAKFFSLLAAKLISRPVSVPPDISNDRNMSEVTAFEGENVTLICHATGVPQPNVTWHREDDLPLPVRSPTPGQLTGAGH